MIIKITGRIILVILIGAKQLRIKGVLKGLDNFYMAGQWIISPGGLPIATVSGKFAIHKILKKGEKKY